MDLCTSLEIGCICKKSEESKCPSLVSAEFRVDLQDTVADRSGPPGVGGLQIRVLENRSIQWKKCHNHRTGPGQLLPLNAATSNYICRCVSCFFFVVLEVIWSRIHLENLYVTPEYRHT